MLIKRDARSLDDSSYGGLGAWNSEVEGKKVLAIKLQPY